jgi:protein TonB
MFTDATFDSLSNQRHGRAWATLTSFGLQAILVTCMMMLPLYYNQVMPLVSPPSIVLTVPRSGPAPEPQTQERLPIGNPGSGSTYHGPTWVVPKEIPKGIPAEGQTDPQIPFERIGTNSLNDPYMVGIPVGIGTGPTIVIPPKPPVPKLIKLSHMSEGSLIYRFEPPYPPVAKAAGIQGPVELAAVIGRDGRIENLQVLSGHPLLVRAALDAVSKWRYRPYILNEQPVEVETRITMNFILSH